MITSIIATARRTTIRPMIAHVRVFCAVLILAGSPAADIHIYPPMMMNITQTNPARGNIMAKILSKGPYSENNTDSFGGFTEGVFPSLKGSDSDANTGLAINVENSTNKFLNIFYKDFGFYVPLLQLLQKS